MKPHFTLVACLAAWGALLAPPTGTVRAQSPVYFRHDGGLAADDERPLPETLEAEQLVWKQALPPGHSTPTVFGERIFLTGHADGELVTMCLEFSTGRVIWRHAVRADQLEKVHTEGSLAAASVACDGRRVYAFFGSLGLLCYGADGTLLWTKQLGPFRDEFGAASSPVLVDGKVILNEDHDLDSFLMAVRHGILESVNDACDWTVIDTAIVVIVSAFLLSAFFNYIYDWRFSSTAVVLTAVFATVGIIFLYFIDRNWQFNPRENRFDRLDIYGSILLFLAAVIIAAMAVALSTRFNIVVTLSACIGLFMLGLVSDYTFGRLADSHLWARICYFLVPNLQIFWISDAIYEGSVVPIKYVLITAFYALGYTAAILSLAIAVFQRRQVG